MRIYNTKTLRLEEFKPLTPGEVKMYVCGPTVYNHAHVGNVRPVVVFDTLRRLFEALGYKVKYVSNYTDVDDKIINEAFKRHISEQELTDEMIAAFNEVRHLLNAKDLYKTPRVTETMDDIIEFIQELVMRGYAYEVDGDVFFRTNAIDDYGSLSSQNIEDLKVGARIEENSKKESPLDFVLWKKTDFGIKWSSCFSKGRPGWHTECVVMIHKELGNLIDIHGGGKDLRFPHHENERAQAKALYKTDLANYWMHSGMIDIEGVKMSKSLGNTIIAKDILAQVDPRVLRWFLLNTHYRSDLNISETMLQSAEKEYNKVANCLHQSLIKLALNNISGEELDIESYERFIEAMSDDMNTPNAYAVIYDIVKNMNQLLRTKDLDMPSLLKYANTLLKALSILGIEYPPLSLSDEDRQLYNDWLRFKAEKDFAKADECRNLLMQRGIL